MSKGTENRELSRKLSIIDQHESRFNAAVQRARACQHAVDEALLAHVKSSFEELRTRIKEAPTEAAPPLTLEAVEEQAGRISRLRVYVLPMAEALNVGISVVSELKEWRVPQEALDATTPLLTDARGTDEARARAAIHNLLFVRDNWHAQFRRYFDNVNWMTKRLTILLALLAVATGLVQSFSIAVAFVLAGLCGTTASILMKPPVLTVFGESIGLFNRTIGRFAAGLIASAAGFGLLASDVLNLNLGEFKSTARLIDGIELCQPFEGARKTLGTRSTSRLTLGEDTPAPGAQQEPESSPPAVTGPSADMPMCDGEPCSCDRRLRWVAFLLTLGLLFGFSERAVSSFEDMIVSRWNPPGR
jgi:hypothetical protein